MDYELPEWEMPMRLRIDSTEVFGSTQEEYQQWLDRLRRYNVPVPVPSSAWTPLSVLWIAAEIDDVFRHLRDKGIAQLNSLDTVIDLEREGDLVKVFLWRDRTGQAPFAELYSAFKSFAERVRHDFLSVCPELQDHVSLGTWFRTGRSNPATREQSTPIYLPPPKD
jgi:hypothetical protein